MAMLFLGGALKRKEKLSGRLSDVLSYLYLASAVLKRYQDDGQPAADLPLVQWACQDAFYNMQRALDGLISNFPNRAMALMLRVLVFPLGRRCRAPSDALGQDVAQLLLVPSDTRDRLTAGMYLPDAEHEPLREIEDALVKVIAAEGVEQKLKHAVKKGILHAGSDEVMLNTALNVGVIDEQEQQLYRDAAEARQRVIRVDDFAADLMSRSETRDAADSDAALGLPG